MKAITNNNGCTLNLGITATSELNAMFNTVDAWNEFINAVTHRFIDIAFLEGRKVKIAICGVRSLNVPKNCTTPRAIAEWINGKDF